MADKISRHEKTKIHITAALIYGQWKSGNTMDKDAEVINKNNISLWTKVLQRLLSIILTLCSLNLAFLDTGKHLTMEAVRVVIS